MGVYKNVMELLVEEEVVSQFQALPPRVASYVNQVEWAAYALNQLPPLYATSETGLRYQLKQAKAKHGTAIKQAVQRALAAIRRDPIRTSTPLQSPHAPFHELLSQLRFVLCNEELEWHMLPIAVEQALDQARQGRMIRPPARRSAAYSPDAPMRKLTLPQYYSDSAAIPIDPVADSSSRSIAQPGAKHKAALPIDSNDYFGWDDPLYNSR